MWSLFWSVVCGLRAILEVGEFDERGIWVEGGDRNAIHYYRKTIISLIMILSFANKETEKIFQRIFVSGLSKELQIKTYRKLLIIDAAVKLVDIRIPPGNYLKALKNTSPQIWSIRVNK